MMDASFLAELRAWARESRHEVHTALRDRERRYTGDDVLVMLLAPFERLDTLLTARLDDERARLVAAAVEAEGRRAEADADFGTWDRAAATAHERHHLTPDDRARIVARMQSAEEECEEAHRAVETARQALADFDAATAGGER